MSPFGVFTTTCRLWVPPGPSRARPRASWARESASWAGSGGFRLHFLTEVVQPVLAPFPSCGPCDVSVAVLNAVSGAP